jgi:D-alanine-D-alanine ligase
LESDVKVALAHDGWTELAGDEELPEDFGAEFDGEETVQALLEAIRADGHEAADLPVGYDLPRRIREVRPDMVFNIAEGVLGPARESLVPAWLDHLRIPYTGSDGLALGCSLDKALAKTLVASRGVRTVPFQRVTSLTDLRQVNLEFPVFAKPNGEGSSMGIRANSLIETPAQLTERVDWVLGHYQQDCLVEEYAPGREFCVGLLGNEEPRCLPIVEVRSARGFYSYEQKSRHEKELICPAELPAELEQEMLQMGREVFRALRCRDLARVDLKLDREGRPSFLEINPLPGLSPGFSIFPHQARAAGLSFNELISDIIDYALQRNQRESERIQI